MEKDWSPMNFEEVADTIDEEDNEISGDGREKLKKYKRHGRPYLVAFGLEDGIRFIFTMSPIMTKVASEADFVTLPTIAAKTIHIYSMYSSL